MSARGPHEVGEALAASGVVRVLDEGPEALLVTTSDLAGLSAFGVLDGWSVLDERRYERPVYPPRPLFSPGGAAVTEEASQGNPSVANAHH